MRSAQIVVYMDPGLLARIDEAAAEENSNRSEWIRHACWKELKELDRRREEE